MEKILETSLTYVDTHTYIMRREGPILIYRDIYCKPNSFSDDFISRVTADKLFRGDLFLRSGLIFFRVVVTIVIRQELIFRRENIRDDGALAKLAKISRTGIKVGLQ